MTVPPTSTMGNPVSYLTLAELKRSPIYNQLQQLVTHSSPSDRDAELGRIIARVSAMMNGEVNQNLAATTDTEVGEIVVSNRGALRVFTRSTPIIEVVSLSVGSSVYNLTPVIDFSHVVLEPWCFTVPPVGGVQLLTGLPQSSFGRPGQRLEGEWTYVNGFPVTTIATAATAGDTSLTVVDSTGIMPNKTLLTIEDGITLETVVPTAVAGNVLTIPALAFSHQVGVGIHALPGDIKEAALGLISRLHDTWSLSMGAITRDGSGATPSEMHAGNGMCNPGKMLSPYKRWW